MKKIIFACLVLAIGFIFLKFTASNKEPAAVNQEASTNNQVAIDKNSASFPSSTVWHYARNITMEVTNYKKPFGESPESPYTLCVPNNSSLLGDAKATMKRDRKPERVLPEVKLVEHDFSQCNSLVLSADEYSKLDKKQKKILSDLLVINESPKAFNGADFSFVLVGNHLLFEINHESIASKGFVLSDRVKDLEYKKPQQ